MTTGRAKVLYADDEDDVRDVFNVVFSADFDVTCVAGGEEALTAMSHETFDVLVTDMRMDPMRGSELLARAYDQFRDTQRILLTGYSDHDDLAEAVNQGHVFAYVQKPWDAEQLRLTIQRAVEQGRLESENRRLVQELLIANARLKDDLESVARAVPPRPRLQVTSPPMAKVFEQVIAVAGTEASVLLYGETGVGKELVAAAIHERSPRKRARFVAQNLAALPPELMTSELFGHSRGASTGAQPLRRGLFELADGGTLFLDEIGEAPLSLQSMLLRALEAREIWPVGATEPRRIDVRIIAATNRDLLADAKEGLFRLDLYYRLAVAPIYIPPLRERPGDVRGLGAPMLEAAARRMGRMLPRLTDLAWAALERHTWPGNVRELSNLMERLAIYHAGHEVEADELGLGPGFSFAPHQMPATSPWGGPAVSSASRITVPPSSREPLSREPLSREPSSREPSSRDFSSRDLSSRDPRELREPVPSSARRNEKVEAVDGDDGATLVLRVPETGTTFDDIEREILVQILARAEGNQSRAARSLGLSESTLRSRLKRLGLKGQ
ncbi:sigma 54-interacting transcriptional regulator [Pendulispora albinea]|uniref:Sigma-54 dependent transcriptional regulator n=1 Tax=Pendulispora albinea TaxID=2741071 RepID=A0ABZ2LRT3_9BACT